MLFPPPWYCNNFFPVVNLRFTVAQKIYKYVSLLLEDNYKNVNLMSNENAISRYND